MGAKKNSMKCKFNFLEKDLVCAAENQIIEEGKENKDPGDMVQVGWM